MTSAEWLILGVITLCLALWIAIAAYENRTDPDQTKPPHPGLW